MQKDWSVSYECWKIPLKLSRHAPTLSSCCQHIDVLSHCPPPAAPRILTRLCRPQGEVCKQHWMGRAVSLFPKCDTKAKSLGNSNADNPNPSLSRWLCSAGGMPDSWGSDTTVPLGNGAVLQPDPHSWMYLENLGLGLVVFLQISIFLVTKIRILHAFIF